MKSIEVQLILSAIFSFFCANAVAQSLSPPPPLKSFISGASTSKTTYCKTSDYFMPTFIEVSMETPDKGYEEILSAEALLPLSKKNLTSGYIKKVNEVLFGNQITSDYKWMALSLSKMSISKSDCNKEREVDLNCNVSNQAMLEVKVYKSSPLSGGYEPALISRVRSEGLKLIQRIDYSQGRLTFYLLAKIGKTAGTLKEMEIQFIEYIDDATCLKKHATIENEELSFF